MTNNEAPILVTAATGKTGRRVAAQLDDAGHAVRRASRSSATRLDWADPSTWAPALDGASAAYVVPPEPGGADLDPFVAAAEAAGVGRLVLLSARGPGQSGDDHLARAEAAVAAGSIPWTVVRPSWFTQNFDEGFFADGLAAGTLALPVGAGLEPFVDADDIAAVAVAALTGTGHEGRTYELSGPEVISFADALDTIAMAGGPTASFADVDPEAWSSDMVSRGIPAGVVTTLSNLFAAIRAGDDAHISSGVEDALGRPATTFAEWAAGAYGSPGAAS